MLPRMTRRFWGGAISSGASALLLALTLLNREWLEVVFRIDPDHGTGTFEWLLVALFVAAALGGALVARVEFARGTEKAEAC